MVCWKSWVQKSFSPGEHSPLPGRGSQFLALSFRGLFLPYSSAHVSVCSVIGVCTHPAVFGFKKKRRKSHTGGGPGILKACQPGVAATFCWALHPVFLSLNGGGKWHGAAQCWEKGRRGKVRTGSAMTQTHQVHSQKNKTAHHVKGNNSFCHSYLLERN